MSIIDLNSVGRPKRTRMFANRSFVVLCVVVAILTVGVLAILLGSIVSQGAGRLTGFSEEALDERVEEMRGKKQWSVIEARIASADPPDWGRVVDEEALDWVMPGAEPAFVRDEMARIYEEQWPALRDRIVAEHGEDWASAAGDLTILQRWRARFDATGLGQFIQTPPSRRPADAGLGPALMGTIWILCVTAVVALPLGVGSAIFLEEFRPTHPVIRRIHAFFELNIRNLAGVPSIVYGIIGLTAFVQMFNAFGNASDPGVAIGAPEDWWYVQMPFGRGVLAGGLTLMLVILPIVIISAQEALRAVPDSIRQGGLACGATKWQVVSKMTLPAAIPGIMTGSILAMSRAIGESAPILVIAGLVFIRFSPQNLMDDFTAMPLQIYDWAGRPQSDFHAVAASGIIVLLAVLLTFNAIAVFIRHKFQKPLE
jgi:phosphate transport system permease protein